MGVSSSKSGSSSNSSSSSSSGSSGSDNININDIVHPIVAHTPSPPPQPLPNDANNDSFTSTENIASIIFLLLLSGVYSFFLLDPKQPRLSSKPRNFVIKDDTLETFKAFWDEYKKDHDYSGSSSYDRYYSAGGRNFTFREPSRTKAYDDFFLETGRDDFYGGHSSSSSSSANKEEDKPVVPSDKYVCRDGGAWLAIRAETNYKYLSMEAGEERWMGATATMDTPLHRRTFRVHPVNGSCAEGHGWVRLETGSSGAGGSPGFVMMVAPTGEAVKTPDEWVVKVGSNLLNATDGDPQYHFLLEQDGYLLNRAALAFVNVISEAEYSVRGHSGGWDRSKPATREYGAEMKFTFVNESLVEEAVAAEAAEMKETEEQDKAYREQIAALPKSTEKRVISFGLYGAKDKYTHGALRNAELAEVYFPGWVCRFYVTSDVPADVVSALKKLGAEVEEVPSGMGYSSGMFWRFMPASDPSVDRFIVRDVDSRLNARDRLAVEAWVESKYPVHVVRDHVNHCLVMNGGMWGAVKGAIPDMKDLVMAWSSRDVYSADLRFLEKSVWPLVKEKQIAHDSYCCDRFPNAEPFPTRRYKTYQHVGQVFSADGRPRMGDIDGFIRGVPVPAKCRKKPEWIYG